jgi:Rnl2 family RNA ligase
MFRKFPSIENSYNGKHVRRVLQAYPELADAKYALLEKIHGTNLQVIFPRGEEGWLFASRKRILEPGEKFYSLNTVAPDYEEVFNTLRAFADKIDKTVRIYGEMFGGKIQAGVSYGNVKMAFFAAAIEDNPLLSWLELEQLFKSLGLENHLVPVVAIVDGLEAALGHSTEIETVFTPKEPKISANNPDNWIEGLIILPLERTYTDINGSTFRLKHKNVWANEGRPEKRRKKAVPPEIALLNIEFKKYLNENRMHSVFSKEGPIEEVKQLGGYIKLILDDAKEDFEKDFEDELAQIPKADIKRVFNVGGHVANMLKEYLAQ